MHYLLTAVVPEEILLRGICEKAGLCFESQTVEWQISFQKNMESILFDPENPMVGIM